MSKITIGAKAGLIAGIVEGILSAPLAYYFILVIKEDMLAGIRSSLKEAPIAVSEEQIFNFIITITPIAVVIASILIGLVVGIIYATIQHKLPAESHIAKAITFSLIIWLIFTIPSITLQPTSVKILNNIWLGIIPVLVYGIVLGLMFQRFLRLESEE
jgi:hypothetical protein